MIHLMARALHFVASLAVCAAVFGAPALLLLGAGG